jgi:probable F420-dependent oxidoreductase
VTAGGAPLKIGIAIAPTDTSIPMVELAAEVEQRGFESLWVTEHSHIPVSRRTPYPYAKNGEVPDEARRLLDPFVALTAAAVNTRTLRIGTGVCVLVQRDPISTAKAVASLDQVSGGRVLFGVGGGWNREEMENHGCAHATRWKLLRERVEAMRAIWTTDEAEYHGELVDFDPIWSWPKPVQRPHPPVLLASSGANALNRVVRYADGWIAAWGDYAPRIADLQRLAAEAGRQPIPVTSYGLVASPSELEKYAQAGVDRAIYYVPSTGRDAALKRLEQLAARARPYVAVG